MRSSRLLPLVILSAALTLGCEQEVTQQGPTDVLLSFITAMRQVHGEEEAGRRVVDLVWKPARDNLRERARRASALSGRELGRGEMIAPSWFALHLNPEPVSERIDGGWAEVTLQGLDGEQVVARCVLEEDGWKVALELPPLAPIRARGAFEERL